MTTYLITAEFEVEGAEDALEAEVMGEYALAELEGADNIRGMAEVIEVRRM